MVTVKCSRCGKEKEHKAKGLCDYCYKKFLWKPKLIVCKRCQREMPNQGRGLCAGCYNFVFHLEDNKSWNYKKWHSIQPELYKKITKKCIVCGFDKVVELHHLNENKLDNSEKNLLGICPNHHKMIHNYNFRKEIFDILTEKGYSPPKDIKVDFINSDK